MTLIRVSNRFSSPFELATKHLTFTAAGFLSALVALILGVAAEVALFALTPVAPEALDDPFLLRACT